MLTPLFTLVSCECSGVNTSAAATKHRLSPLCCSPLTPSTPLPPLSLLLEKVQHLGLTFARLGAIRGSKIYVMHRRFLCEVNSGRFPTCPPGGRGAGFPSLIFLLFFFLLAQYMNPIAEYQVTQESNVPVTVTIVPLHHLTCLTPTCAL